MRTAGRWLYGIALAVLAIVGLAPARAAAQDADAREVSAYRLTEATLAKFIRASRAMAAVATTMRDTADDDEDDDGDEDDDDDTSIASITAFYDTTPAARRAITGAGLSTREFVVFTFALLQAGMGAWLVEQQGWSKLPPDFARANVEFYQRHKALLDSLTAELRQDDEEEDPATE